MDLLQEASQRSTCQSEITLPTHGTKYLDIIEELRGHYAKAKGLNPAQLQPIRGRFTNIDIWASAHTGYRRHNLCLHWSRSKCSVCKE